MCRKLKVKITHSSMKSRGNKYVFLPNLVEIDAVKAINYPGITWVVHTDKTWSGPAANGRALPGPHERLLWSPTDDPPCPPAPPTNRWSKIHSEQLLFLLICFNLTSFKLWNFDCMKCKCQQWEIEQITPGNGNVCECSMLNQDFYSFWSKLNIAAFLVV